MAANSQPAAGAQPERIRVLVRPGKDDWIGVAYSSKTCNPDTIREYIAADLAATPAETCAQCESYKKFARDMEEAIDNVREALGLESTHWLVIADQVRDVVKERNQLRAATTPSRDGAILAFIQEVADEGCLRGRQVHCAEREPNSTDWCVACKAKYLFMEKKDAS